MSIVSLFIKTAPTIAGASFDAVLEDTLDTETQWTQYPIESGASAVDHGILLPFRYTITGAVSNNPITPSITDFAGVLSEALEIGGVTSQLLGGFIGAFSGSDGTRSADALQYLINVQAARIPFDVYAGDIELKNMVISGISRTKDPANEQALIFTARLQELTNLDRLLSGDREPSQFELRTGDPSKTMAARIVENGQKTLKNISDNVQSVVDEVLS